MHSLDFSPPSWASNGWFQTLAAFAWPRVQALHPDYQQRLQLLELPDGDQLALRLHDRRKELGPAPHRRAILVHGLCGDQDSAYMRRCALRLMQGGHDLCVVNLRGCGPGKGLAQEPYHAGRSEDLRSVVTWLRLIYPEQALDLIGFSLGANLVLKYLSECPEHAQQPVDRAFAISPPIDLEASCERLMAAPWGAADRFFTRLLVAHVRSNHAAHPSLGPEPNWPKGMTLRQFDELYTAPKAGYPSARHYYQDASAGPRLHKIKVPTELLWAQDDPLIDQHALARVQSSSSIRYRPLATGGHIGFLDPLARGGDRFWLFEALARWMDRGAKELSEAR